MNPGKTTATEMLSYQIYLCKHKCRDEHVNRICRHALFLPPRRFPKMQDLLILLAIASMAVVSGMLGIGVAFAAIPILSLGGLDLVHGVQPIALFLNGVTALCSAISFGRAGYVDLGRSLQLAGVATVFSPVGAFAALHASEPMLWGCYFVTVAVTLYFMHQKQVQTDERLSFSWVLALAAPVAALSGLLGVGAGFLLVPLMVFSGFSIHRAAAMNSVAVVPASFASLIPHLGSATVSVSYALPIAACAALGAFFGGFLSSWTVSEKGLRRLFIVVMVALAAYKLGALVLNGYSSGGTASTCARRDFVLVELEVSPCP